MSAALRHLELPGLQLQGRPGPYLGRRHPKLAFQWESFPAHSSSSTAASSCSRAPPSQGLPFFGSRHRPARPHIWTSLGAAAPMPAHLAASPQSSRQGSRGEGARQDRPPGALRGIWKWEAGGQLAADSTLPARLALASASQQSSALPGRGDPGPLPPPTLGLGGGPEEGQGLWTPCMVRSLSLSPSLSLPPTLWEAWAGSWGPARVGSIG